MKLLAVIILILLCATPVTALTLSDEKFSDDPMENSVIQRMDYFTRLFIELGIPYTWGGAYGILGIDCSGSVSAVLRSSGVRHFRRDTAYNMWFTWGYKQKWTANPEMWKEAKFPYLIYFTFPTKKTPRPFGHVAFARGKRKGIVMAEASSSAHYFKETEFIKGSVHDKSWVGLMKLNLIPGK
jgi:hypothetical protein